MIRRIHMRVRAPLEWRSIGVFFMGQDVGGFVDSWPKTLVPSASNRSAPEWTLVDSVDSRQGRFDEKQLRASSRRAGLRPLAADQLGQIADHAHGMAHEEAAERWHAVHGREPDVAGDAQRLDVVGE